MFFFNLCHIVVSDFVCDRYEIRFYMMEMDKVNTIFVTSENFYRVK